MKHPTGCSRRRFLGASAVGAAFLLGRRLSAQPSAPPSPAQVGIFVDLEMARNFPRWEDQNWDYEKSPNLQDARLEKWLAQNELSLIVRSVDADEFGGAAISIGRDLVLRLFPAGTRGEEWRLFRPKTDFPHLVVTGGAVEPDDEPGA